MAEDQLQEIEALESIFSQELQIDSREYPGISFRVILSSQQQQYEDSNKAIIIAVDFILPDKYPDVIPEMEVETLQGELTDKRIEELRKDLIRVAEENLQMPAIFMIISHLQEQMIKLVEEKEEQIEQVKLDKIRAEEEYEKKRVTGTLVTVETFMNWKTQFDFERLQVQFKMEKAQKEAQKKEGKLTGKEQFLRDASLNLSDLSLMQNEENEKDKLNIDESLFDDDIEDEFDELQ